MEDMLKKYKNNSDKLIFVHIPKCGGTYVRTIIKKFGIKNTHHNQAIKNKNKDNIYFTVVRDPIERFESLLNYRLNEKKPRKDFPIRLHHVYDNINIELNEIVHNLTDDEILNFIPFRTLKYYMKNVKIAFTIDKLNVFMKYFGYEYKDIDKVNVSIKKRGTFNNKTKVRLKKVFNEDIILYNNIINFRYNYDDPIPE